MTQGPEPVIDAHSHLWQGFMTDRGLASPSEAIRLVPKTRIDELQADPRALSRALAQAGVRNVATFAQEMTRVWRQWLGSNELAVALQRHWPEVVLAVVGAEPLDVQDRLNSRRLDEVEALVRDRGARGMLFTPPYGHYYANDPRVYPFYALARTLDVPVMFHHSAQLGQDVLCPMKYARPWLLDEVAIDFPGLRILIEHMGYPWTEETLALMAHAPHVYTDISTLQRRPTMLAWNLVMAREYGVLDRVMWGTDYVGEDHAAYAAIVAREVAFVRTSLNDYLTRSGWPALTEREIRGLLHDNAARFYRLEAGGPA